MRSAPEEYRQPTADELDVLWKDALVVFDASSLLRLAEFSKRTSAACFKAMKALGDRLWLPNQASFEFYKNTRSSRAEVSDARMQLDALLSRVDITIQGVLRLTKHPNLVDAFSDSWEKSKESIRIAIDSADMPPDDLAAHFNALETVLSDLYIGKTGPAYDDRRSRAIYADGEERYKSRIPPGFEDLKKPAPDRFGDLVLWYQILDQAKAAAKPIILVTDDQKDDWWLRVTDRQKPDGSKIVIGPHPHLIREMRTIADQRLWMYVMSDFIAESRERLNVDEADQVTVAEIRQVEALGESQINRNHYNQTMELLSRLSQARRAPSGDISSQLQDVEILLEDLTEWYRTKRDLELPQKKLLESMGMSGALSQIPEVINAGLEIAWLSSEIARLRSELGFM